MGIALRLLRQDREAQQALEKLMVGYADKGPFAIAVVLGWRNEMDTAFVWLDKAYDRRIAIMAWAKTDPLLKLLREDPRFRVLLRKMKLAD